MQGNGYAKSDEHKREQNGEHRPAIEMRSKGSGEQVIAAKEIEPNQYASNVASCFCRSLCEIFA